MWSVGKHKIISNWSVIYINIPVCFEIHRQRIRGESIAIHKETRPAHKDDKTPIVKKVWRWFWERGQRCEGMLSKVEGDFAVILPLSTRNHQQKDEILRRFSIVSRRRESQVPKR